MKYIYLSQMKRSSAFFRLWMIVILFTLSAFGLQAQYTSKVVTGNYEDASSWVTPPSSLTTGVVSGQTMTIDGVITRNGNITNQTTITVSSSKTLNITGSYTEAGSWGGGLLLILVQQLMLQVVLMLLWLLFMVL